MEAMNGIPPQIPGYTFAQKLGSGSEANVYLYQQLSPADKWPSRSARGTLDPRARRRGSVQANFMGRISPHPYILSVYESGVTTTGNGYTVFEYAPGGNYKTFLQQAQRRPDAYRRHQSGERPFHSAPRRHHTPRHQAQQYSHQHAWHAHAFRFRHRGNDLRASRHRLHHRVGSAGKCSQRTAEATNPPIFIRWEQRCSPC